MSEFLEADVRTQIMPGPRLVRPLSDAVPRKPVRSCVSVAKDSLSQYVGGEKNIIFKRVLASSPVVQFKCAGSDHLPEADDGVGKQRRIVPVRGGLRRAYPADIGI